MAARNRARGVLGFVGFVLFATGLVSATGDGAVPVRGRVMDARGAGLPATLLVISAEGQLLARHVAAADGTFAFDVTTVPVEIVPDLDRPGYWEFEPRADRVNGGYLDLEFTGYNDPALGLRFRFVDSATGKPLVDTPVTIHRTCPLDGADPAARYRQGSMTVRRTNLGGGVKTPCSLVCETTIQFRGDHRYASALLDVAAGDCADRHFIAVDPR